MSYRYNTIDIIEGVGMCAIVFGALLLFIAANETIHAAPPQPIVIEQPADIQVGMIWLQPALGQAIVDQMFFERRSNQVMVQAASEWNQATLAYHEFRFSQAVPSEPSCVRPLQSQLNIRLVFKASWDGPS